MGAGENTTSMMGTFTVSRMDPSDIVNLASEFVVQYYTVMRKCPSGLHRFYKDDSAMIHENASVFGQKMIHDKIMSMDFQNSRVGILRLDALRANGNSVLIQVSGEMSVSGGEFRRFMQSFVLCEQAPCDFYVLNDIFRFQDHVYGDVKTEERTETKRTESEQIIGLSSEDLSRMQGNLVESESQNIVNWEKTTPSELNYSKGESTIESHSHPEEAHEPETSHEQHMTIRSPSPQPMSSEMPEETLYTAPAAPQPCTWAAVASKQPSHVPVNMQSSKFAKAPPQVVPQSFDESSKANRQSSIGLMNQRPRGGRSQPMTDVRVASGDHGFQQDSRQSAPMRSSSGRGGPMGMRGGGGGRGGRGGFGNPGIGGRGGSFSRRGQ